MAWDPGLRGPEREATKDEAQGSFSRPGLGLHAWIGQKPRVKCSTDKDYT